MPALDLPQHGLKARHAEKWARKFSPVLPETPLSVNVKIVVAKKIHAA
jgi:hypothetical protein